MRSIARFVSTGVLAAFAAPVWCLAYWRLPETRVAREGGTVRGALAATLWLRLWLWRRWRPADA